MTIIDLRRKSNITHPINFRLNADDNYYRCDSCAIKNGFRPNDGHFPGMRYLQTNCQFLTPLMLWQFLA